MADVTRKTPPDHEVPLAQDLSNAQVEKVQEAEKRMRELEDERRAQPTAKERDKLKEKKDALKPSANDLRAALQARTEQISRRVDAIQQEVAQVPGEVGEAIVRNPLVSVGVSLAAGLAVGLLIGGIGRKKSKLPAAHQALVEDYLDALADEARRLIHRGEDAGKAIRRALGKHTPLIVTSGHSDLQSTAGFVRTALDMAVKTALGFATKVAIDKALIASGLADQMPAVEQAVKGPGHPETIAAVADES